MVAIVAIAACSDATSATDLNTGGPPMVEQVRLLDLSDPSHPAVPVFAFGAHPQASEGEVHPVTRAQASSNRLRVVMDELLRGNGLEEILCRAGIDDDAYDRVPLGTTPDDIARCSVAQDVLVARCPASNPHSVCICKRPEGCLVEGSIQVPEGQSVGIQDNDQDGTVDDTRFIRGAVAIRCNDLDVPLDLDLSYWTPSGTQERPAQGGFDALGPAIVLVTAGALPTSTTCSVAFSPEVVDKDGNQVCAPPGGDVEAGCTPGDTSAISFGVEPLRLAVELLNPTQQSRTAKISIATNVPLDADSLANITVVEGDATPYTAFTAALDDKGRIIITWTAAGGLAAATRYTITVPTTVTDAYHQAGTTPLVLTFTTAAT